MTHIKLTTDLGGHKTGDTIEVTNGVAEHLTSNGYAEATDAPKPKGRPKGQAPATKPDTNEGGGASAPNPATTAG